MKFDEAEWIERKNIAEKEYCGEERECSLFYYIKEKDDFLMELIVVGVGLSRSKEFLIVDRLSPFK